MEAESQILEQMVWELEATDRFRVLRRLIPPRTIAQRDGSETRTGLFLDVETTGLDPITDDVIELAMVPFTFGCDGRIFEVLSPFDQLHEPNVPIPNEITKLTGIRMEDVAGRTIDRRQVEEIAAGADLIIAHNARFDRPFVERLSPLFEKKPWGCSMTQIDWRTAGYEGLKLEYLAMRSGFFYDRHRAVEDCYAGIQLLATVLPSTNKPAMAQLMGNVLKETCQFSLRNVPFDLNPALRGRGYRFGRNSITGEATWSTEVSERDKCGELEFLARENHHQRFCVDQTRTTAVERFSARACR